MRTDCYRNQLCHVGDIYAFERPKSLGLTNVVKKKKNDQQELSVQTVYSQQGRNQMSYHHTGFGIRKEHKLQT